MITKHLGVEVEKSDNPGFDARFIMSATSPDRVKDTIEQSAYAPNLGKKLIALYQHNPDEPIGFWDQLAVDAGNLKGYIKFASTNLGQMVKTLINDGVPLGASIGFRGNGEPNKKGGIHFKEIELLECSVVSVPCHPAAMQIAKNFGIDLKSIEINPETVDSDPIEKVARAKRAIAKANLTLRAKK